MSKDKKKEAVEEENTVSEESLADEKPEDEVQASSETEERDPDAELVDKVRFLEAENAELKDQYIRKQADYENFRKRMVRDKEEAIRYANSSLLADLVAIIDDFERAIKSSVDSQDYQVFHSGIEMIESQFTGMLDKKYGLKRFESLGEEFDPQFHEAIGMEPSDKYDVQTVLEVYQNGYTLGDRVLRHAKVKISQPVESTQTEADDQKEN